MSRLVISIIAGITLIAVNGFLSIVQFLGNDVLQVSLFIIFIILSILAFILHRRWILYLAQTSIFLYPIYGNLKSYIPSSSTITTSSEFGFLYFLIIMAFSYFLAWLVTRSIETHDR